MSHDTEHSADKPNTHDGQTYPSGEAETERNVQQAIETLHEPISDEDLQTEIKHAARGLTRSTRYLAIVALMALAFTSGVWVRAALQNTSSTPAQDNSATTVNGVVQRRDNTTLYVTEPDGQQARVSLLQPDHVEVARPGSVTDLSPGTRVAIEGRPGQDGTLSANRVTKQEP